MGVNRLFCLPQYLVTDICLFVDEAIVTRFLRLTERSTHFPRGFVIHSSPFNQVVRGIQPTIFFSGINSSFRQPLSSILLYLPVVAETSLITLLEDCPICADGLVHMATEML